MSVLLHLLGLALCVVASALYSGSETGMYSLSRARLDAEARSGNLRARMIEALLRNDGLLLVTILVGNNLAIELAAHLGESLAADLGISPAWREVVLTACLTPFLFLFAELLPKDLFHRRPHAATAAAVPFVAFSRVVYLPISLPLLALAWLLQRSLGLSTHALARVHGRESVLEILQEGDAAIDAEGAKIARNALDLSSIDVQRVMVPWSRVAVIDARAKPAERRRAAGQSAFSRLPVVGPGGRVRGYVHQLDVLAADPDTPLDAHLRPLECLALDTRIDQALAHLRASGQRMALVGSEERPRGLVTLKDLVEEISGELARW